MTASPETKPQPIVVIQGTIVHRASAVRQITGPRPVPPMRHASASRPEVAAADSHILDRVIRGIAAVIVVVEVVKSGAPWWLVARLADGLIVAHALTTR